MKADLHVHSSPASPYALSSAREMIAAAAERRTAVALTEAGLLRGKMAQGDVVGLGQMMGVRVFAGASVATRYGRVLVYGVVPDYDLEMPEADPLALVEWVRSEGGATVVPHLFRDLDRRRRDEVLEGRLDWWLRKVDRLELTWLDERPNDHFVTDTAERLGKGLSYGTAANWHRHVGKWGGDWLPDEVRTDADLVAFLREQP